jgi:hypothetical protein
MSPGTSSDACIRVIWPDLRTFASSGEYSLSAYLMQGPSQLLLFGDEKMTDINCFFGT